MPQQAHSKFSRHLLPGFCSGFAIALALFSLDPALAASLDCPKARPAFLADSVWRVNDSVTAKNLRILAIGSSSTEGIGASAPAFTYPAQLQARLAILLGGPVEVDNFGVGGETVAKTVVRLKAALAGSKPDLVIWQVGTNDAVTGEDEASFRASLLDGVAAIRAVKTPFVLLDPQFYPGLKDIAHYEQYVRIIHDAGERNGAALFSRYALMKEWGAESDGLLRAMLSKDAFHMSDRGYGCLAQSLAADLAPRLRHLSTQAIDSSGVTGSIVK
jgi:lysophospholipase L1-like esterase